MSVLPTHPSTEAQTAVAETNTTLIRRAALAGLIGTLFLRLAGGLATSSLGLYLRSLETAGAKVNPLEVGFVATGYYATELLFAPVLGALSDRVGRKFFMVAAPLIGAIALTLYPLSSAIAVLFLVRVLEGISAGGAVPATLGYLSDVTDGSPQRGRIMGFFEIVTLGGVAFGVVLGPILWSSLHTHIYPFLALLYLFGALIFGFGLPAIGARHHKHHGWRDFVSILSSRRLLRFIPAWIAVNAVVGLWIVHLQNQLSGPAGRVPGQALAGGLNGTRLSTVLAAFAIAFLAGLYFWGARAKGRRTGPMLIAGVGVLVLSFCLLALNHPDSLIALGLPSLFWFIALLAAGFVMAGFTPVALAYLADISEDFPGRRGIVVGLYSVFFALGQLLGGNIGGLVIRSLHVDGIVLMTAALALIAMVSVANIRRHSND